MTVKERLHKLIDEFSISEATASEVEAILVRRERVAVDPLPDEIEALEESDREVASGAVAIPLEQAKRDFDW